VWKFWNDAEEQDLSTLVGARSKKRSAPATTRKPAAKKQKGKGKEKAAEIELSDSELSEVD
jgi:hypothetical protein